MSDEEYEIAVGLRCSDCRKNLPCRCVKKKAE
jgi:hypothetical protein